MYAKNLCKAWFLGNIVTCKLLDETELRTHVFSEPWMWLWNPAVLHGVSLFPSYSPDFFRFNDWKKNLIILKWFHKQPITVDILQWMRRLWVVRLWFMYDGCSFLKPRCFVFSERLQQTLEIRNFRVSSFDFLPLLNTFVSNCRFFSNWLFFPLGIIFWLYVYYLFR